MNWNATRREKLMQAACKRAGIAKKRAFAHIGDHTTNVVVATSLGNLSMQSAHQLFYHLRILAPSDHCVFVGEKEGRSWTTRLFILPEGC